MVDMKEVLLLLLINFLIKNDLVIVLMMKLNKMNNQLKYDKHQLQTKFKRMKVYSSFKNNISGAESKDNDIVMYSALSEGKSVVEFLLLISKIWQNFKKKN